MQNIKRQRETYDRRDLGLSMLIHTAKYRKMCARLRFLQMLLFCFANYRQCLVYSEQARFESDLSRGRFAKVPRNFTVSLPKRQTIVLYFPSYEDCHPHPLIKFPCIVFAIVARLDVNIGRRDAYYCFLSLIIGSCHVFKY